ncbi:Transcription factor bzip [Lasiodiplodia theobromae]|uniref:BZIP domain-containing protein n=1 Tax=Lasiodiplodia theobromae TaxID=45133 RepID=A0A5N5DT08_9PEZI|nr:Transcription factor bzip [Lasiodiplodia theobromae]KAB2580072.1 hypothetical protein DBV05_g1394 [Lasiodiplodia theobromae]KAF4540843.1 Transcription factor bzip [Lasiodiplodia theobromae]
MQPTAMPLPGNGSRPPRTPANPPLSTRDELEHRPPVGVILPHSNSPQLVISLDLPPVTSASPPLCPPSLTLPCARPDAPTHSTPSVSWSATPREALPSRAVILAAPDLAVPYQHHHPYRVSFPQSPPASQLDLRLRLQDPVDLRQLEDRGRDASWSTHRGARHPDDKDLMSQQHGSRSGPSSTFLHDVSSRPTAARSYTSPAGPPSAMLSLSGGARYEQLQGRGPALPPIHPPTSEPTPPRSEDRTPRALGVHSILNPSGDGSLSAESKARSRTASQMESPSPVDRLPGPSPHMSHGVPSYEDQRRQHAHTSSIGHRRVLSPRSPLYRSQSLGMIRPPTGTINAQETPFLSPSSQDYRHEPGSAPNPPLPTPPAAQRSGYNFPPPPPSSIPTPPIQQSHSRRTSGGMSQPPQPQSASASPRGMYSYGPAGQHSPAASLGEIGRPSPVPFQSAPSSAPPPPQFSSQEPDRSYGIPVASTGQSNYQLLTLETNQGHVQIPVDVQAASKMADEKRKRNAGASARFRARRKEKEREASSTIARLEQQIREANEDVEYYKRERDYFAQLVYQAPGGDRHFPRPPSPRLRRLSMQAQGSTGASSGQGSTSASSTPGTGFSTYPSDHRSEQRPAESDRNVRRRTSSYLPPPGAVPGQQAQPQVAYPPASYPPLAAASPVPGSRTPSASMQHAPPQQPQQQQQQQQPPQPGYPTPYAPERTDRSWPPQTSAGRGPPGLPPPGQH